MRTAYRGDDTESEQHALALLNEFQIHPAVGEALVPLAKDASALLADLAHAKRLLLQIAGRLNGDRSMADLDRTLIRIPGTSGTNTYPARTACVEVFEPSRVYTVARIEEWLSWAR